MEARLEPGKGLVYVFPTVTKSIAEVYCPAYTFQWGDPDTLLVTTVHFHQYHIICMSGFVVTLEQACPKEYQGAQCAFKDSMIH